MSQEPKYQDPDFRGENTITPIICAKKRYETKEDAISTIMYLETSKKVDYCEVHYYKCHVCSSFHLTSKRKEWEII